jgi:hypothetical protein
VPVTELEQAMRNLALANEIRTRRSQLKEDLKAGRVLLADVLLADHDWLQTMRIWELLLATPGIGRVKADRALRLCWIGPNTKVSATTRTNREKLLEHLADRHPTAEVGWRAAA